MHQSNAKFSFADRLKLMKAAHSVNETASGAVGRRLHHAPETGAAMRASFIHVGQESNKGSPAEITKAHGNTVGHLCADVAKPTLHDSQTIMWTDGVKVTGQHQMLRDQAKPPTTEVKNNINESESLKAEGIINRSAMAACGEQVRPIRAVSGSHEHTELPGHDPQPPEVEASDVVRDEANEIPRVKDTLHEEHVASSVNMSRSALHGADESAAEQPPALRTAQPEADHSSLSIGSPNVPPQSDGNTVTNPNASPRGAMHESNGWITDETSGNWTGLSDTACATSGEGLRHDLVERRCPQHSDCDEPHMRSDARKSHASSAIEPPAAPKTTTPCPVDLVDDTAGIDTSTEDGDPTQPMATQFDGSESCVSPPYISAQSLRSQWSRADSRRAANDDSDNTADESGAAQHGSEATLRKMKVSVHSAQPSSSKNAMYSLHCLSSATEQRLGAGPCRAYPTQGLATRREAADGDSRSLSLTYWSSSLDSTAVRARIYKFIVLYTTAVVQGTEPTLLLVGCFSRCLSSRCVTTTVQYHPVLQSRHSKQSGVYYNPDAGCLQTRNSTTTQALRGLLGPHGARQHAKGAHAAVVCAGSRSGYKSNFSERITWLH